MKISVNSFSFNKSLASGKHDIFKYIKDSYKLECTQLDPWYGHFTELRNDDSELNQEEIKYLQKAKLLGDKLGLEFESITVDGGTHVYEKNEENRLKNRKKAYKWIAVAHQLGASYVRFDAGNVNDSEELTSETLRIVVEGYQDLINVAKKLNIGILIENHWGLTSNSDNIIRILNEVPDLGLLLDSWNWGKREQPKGWLDCAKYAKAIHIKTFNFTKDGQDMTQNIPAFCSLLLENNYQGCWTVESMPIDENEFDAARKTIKLIKSCILN